MLDTQLEAYFNLETKVGQWQYAIIRELIAVYPLGLTTEELAIIIGESEGNIQPRTRELSRCDKDLIRPTNRSVNSRGNRVASWVYNPNPEPRPYITPKKGNKDLWESLVEKAIQRKQGGKIAHEMKQEYDALKIWWDNFTEKNI